MAVKLLKAVKNVLKLRTTADYCGCCALLCIAVHLLRICCAFTAEKCGEKRYKT